MTHVVSSCSAIRRAIADGICVREGASKSLVVDEARVLEGIGWRSRVEASRPGWRRARPETANRVRESMLSIACLVVCDGEVYMSKDRTSIVGVRKSERAGCGVDRLEEFSKCSNTLRHRLHGARAFCESSPFANMTSMWCRERRACSARGFHTFHGNVADSRLPRERASDNFTFATISCIKLHEIHRREFTATAKPGLD